MNLSELVRLAFPFCGIEIDCQTEIGYIEVNTESAIEHSAEKPLFVCICGARHDTHMDIEKLVCEGVRCFVVDENAKISLEESDVQLIKVHDTRRALAQLARAFYGFPDRELFTVGITGTKGKTTVTYMLSSIFEENLHKCGIIGSNGIIYGNKIIDCANSTPGPLEYYGALRKMSDCGITHVFCEVTSQALKQSRTLGTFFDIAVFTNLFPDHIGASEHKDFEEYKNCKGLLFEQCKRAVLNLDSSHFSFFEDICNKEKVSYATYSVSNNNADYFCKKNEVSDSGSVITIKSQRFHVPLPGDFNVSNTACALSVAKLCVISDEVIAKGLKKVKVLGRCEKVPNPAGVNIIIDYAHSGESLENILGSLKKTCTGKLYCVFGAGGNRSRLRRSGMGKAASRYADFSVITSDNPRHESLDGIISDIISGASFREGCFAVVPDRREAIFTALSMAKKGDTLLLAGKGGQTYEEIGDTKFHFDEREIVSEFYDRRKRLN